MAEKHGAVTFNLKAGSKRPCWIQHIGKFLFCLKGFRDGLVHLNRNFKK
jgi:hypothetical protein